MRRALARLTVGLTVVALLALGSLVTVSVCPYVYTKVLGDAGTERLYQLYRMARQDGSKVEQLVKFAATNRLVTIDHPKDGILTAHNDSETNTETVIVWYSAGTVTNARFTTEP